MSSWASSAWVVHACACAGAEDQSASAGLGSPATARARGWVECLGGVARGEGGAAAGGVDGRGAALAGGLVDADAVAPVGVEPVDGGHAPGSGVGDALAGVGVEDRTAAARDDGGAHASARADVEPLAAGTGLEGSAPAGGVDGGGAADALLLLQALAVAGLRVEEVQVGHAPGSRVGNARAGLSAEDEPASAALGARASALALAVVEDLRGLAGGQSSASASGVHRLGGAGAGLLVQADAVATGGVESVQVGHASGVGVWQARAGQTVEDESATALLH